MTGTKDPPGTIHATVVARDGRGLMLTGPSGSGKSALALELMSLGCRLVADDRVVLSTRGKGLVASAPEAIRGLIEARGVGLLNVPNIEDEAIVVAEVDLSRTEEERLPPERQITHNGVTIPVLCRPPGPSGAAALLHYLTFGRHS